MVAFLALWLPWFLWRYWYYGWPFPNTYYVKAHGPWQPPELAVQMWRNGGYYLWIWGVQTGLFWVSPLLLLGGVSRIGGTSQRALIGLLALFAASYLLYTASVGGDFMGLHRFILPVLVVAAVVVTRGIKVLCEHPSWPAGLQRRWRRRRSVGVALLLLSALVVKQLSLTAESVKWGAFEADHGIDTPAFLMAYTRDRAEIGKALHGCLRSDDFSIVGGAGAQPYYGDMRGIDVFGLVSDEVAHQEPRIRARAGHTKFASDSLLLALDPTFVFSCYAIHATPERPNLPCSTPWLSRGFEVVTLHVPTMRQRGTYFSFLAKQSRSFRCAGLVR
jgi:hypothetical protein